jgi:hypothetical protein
MTDIERIPADGVVARRYVVLEESLSEEQLLYLYICLIAGMRGEALPRPRRDLDLSVSEGEAVRARVKQKLPEIDAVRAGETPLPPKPGGSPTMPAPEADPLPF